MARRELGEIEGYQKASRLILIHRNICNKNHHNYTENVLLLNGGNVLVSCYFSVCITIVDISESKIRKLIDPNIQ